MNFIELLKNYGVYLILTIIIVTVIISIISSKRKHRKNKNNSYSSSFGGQSYQNSILNSLPYEDRLDYTNLYNKIDRIQNIINVNKISLDEQKSEAIDSIQAKVTDSQIHIENHWRKLKQKKEFYHCIGLHYASFTLADKIKREQESIREVFVKLKYECDRLSVEIDKLNIKIQNTRGTHRYELMQEHKKLCNQHQRASKLKGVFGSRNTQFLNMVKAQNDRTRQYRDYIINNFGAKGKQWGDRLRKRKMDQVQ